jgi:hypothetical protein
MSGKIQDGNDVKYVLNGDITAFSPYNRAFKYSDVTGEVTLAGDGDTNFAGILVAVQISRSSQSPYNVTAYDGDNVTLSKTGMFEVIANGAVKYGQAIGLAANGTFKALPDYDTSPSLDLIVKKVGRAEGNAADGEVFIINLRK